MKQKLTENDHIFDGFVHRNFDPKFDGWRNEIPDVRDYRCVQNARDTLALFDELCAAKRRIWELEQEVDMWKPVQFKMSQEN